MDAKAEEGGAVVRAYEARDRQAVREISYETADAGAPAVRIFSDRELIADMLTRYYTDYEAGSAFVAESGWRVVGYLTGCMDTRRQIRVTMRRILPAAAFAAVLAGALWRRGTARLVASGVRALVSGGAERGVDLERFPAHLHINILPGFRGKRVGPQLVEAFLAEAKARGVAGVHASIREDNAGARGFFERQGFVEIGKQPTILVPEGAGVLRSVIYGRML